MSTTVSTTVSTTGKSLTDARINPNSNRVKRLRLPAGGGRTPGNSESQGVVGGLIHAARVSLVLGVAALVFIGSARDRAAADEDLATFEMTVNITWSASTAPFEFPLDAHMSGLTGATHNERYALFRDGQTASSGLELVAENGRVATLRAELAEAKRRRQVGAEISGPGLGKLPGTIVAKFTTGKDHPLLSFITMIAPSPDWFAGVADVKLLKDGKWIDNANIMLWAWDSGTDSGDTYQSRDADMQPQESIRLLATPHFLTERGLVPMGSMTIRRIAPE